MERKEKRTYFQRYVSKLPLAFFLLWVGLVALVAFGVLAHEVLGEKEDGFDQFVFNFLQKHIVSVHLTPLMEAITFLASQTFLLPAYLALAAHFFYKKQKRRAVEVLLIGSLGQLLNYIMKLFYHRTRPAGPFINPLASFSFPSGHSMSAFIFYGLLIYLTWDTRLAQGVKVLRTVVLVVIAVAVGFSRVYLRAHYPTDVLAGFCLGLTWLCFAVWVLEQIKKKAISETVSPKTTT